MTMKILIKEKQEIAKGTVLFTFDAPGGGLSWVPGQYVSLKLDLRFPDEKGPQRYFSIVNPDPESGRIQIATRISDTGFKQTLDALQPGEAGEITEIAGKFILPEDAKKEIVMVAGGVGVTPFKCMLEHLILKKEKRRITVLYSNKNKATTAFYEEFSKWRNKLSGASLFCHDPGRRLARSQRPHERGFYRVQYPRVPGKVFHGGPGPQILSPASIRPWKN